MLAAILCSMVYNIFLDCISASADYGTEISAASAIVMAADGSCIYEKNADEPRLIASTTKLMTALVAIEASKPDDPIEVQAECCGIEGTSMYLSPGEIRTADELLEGLLLASGNDAAEALSVGLYGSEEAFVAQMNKKARLGAHCVYKPSWARCGGTPLHCARSRKIDALLHAKRKVCRHYCDAAMRD